MSVEVVELQICVWEFSSRAAMTLLGGQVNHEPEGKAGIGV